ncbi:syntaxin-51-like [Wolffia australiana]
MASSFVDTWARDYGEASRLAEEVAAMVAEKGSSSSPSLAGGAVAEARRQSPAIRRKITILGARLDGLDSFLANVSALRPPITEKELQRRRSLLTTLRSKTQQMAAALNMSNFAAREDLLGQREKSDEGGDRVSGLDSRGIIGLQRQIMKEQDEGLGKLEETVLSTKHIALAVNEELDLHARLIDNLDEHVESTTSRLQRVQKRLAILNRSMKGGCSCGCLLLSMLTIVILVVVAWALIKYL